MMQDCEKDYVPLSAFAVQVNCKPFRMGIATDEVFTAPVIGHVTTQSQHIKVSEEECL